MLRRKESGQEPYPVSSWPSLLLGREECLARAGVSFPWTSQYPGK